MRKVGPIGGSPKRLAINRRTVSRYVRQQRADRSKCTSAPIEPGRLDADSKCTTAPSGSLVAAESAPSDLCFRAAAPRSSTSRCAHWREFILAKHAQGLSAVRIHQDLRGEPGTEAISYDSVRRFLKRLGAQRPLPFRRMECEPGAGGADRLRSRRADYNSRRKAPQDPRAAGDLVALAQGL